MFDTTHKYSIYDLLAVPGNGTPNLLLAVENMNTMSNIKSQLMKLRKHIVHTHTHAFTHKHTPLLSSQVLEVC